MTDTARELVSSESIQNTVVSCFRRYICAENLKCRFAEALRLVQKQSDESASEDSGPTKDALGGTHFGSRLLLSAGEHDGLLYVEISAAHTQDQKQNAAFIGRTF